MRAGDILNKEFVIAMPGGGTRPANLERAEDRAAIREYLIHAEKKRPMLRRRKK